MIAFEHATPAFRTFCGPDCLGALPKELERLGVRRVVLVHGASLARHAEALGRVAAAVGPRLAGCFDGVRPHSPVPVVEAAAELLGRLGADAVVAVGGGSAVVTARAATILLAERRPVRALCTRREADGGLVSPRLSAPKLPQWVVATTPTTAYAKAGSAVRDPDTGERLALFDPKTRAQGVFLDPLMAATAPAGLAVSAGLNAFAMAVAGLESAVDDPLAEALLRQSLSMLGAALPRLRTEPASADARLALMVAALLSGQGTDYVGGGACAAISHVVGPHAGIDNGLADAILLPHVMRFNAPATGARAGRIATALDARSPDAAATSAEDAIGAVDRVLAVLSTPRRLRDVGVAVGALPALAAHAAEDWSLQRNPRPAGRDEVLGLLRAAW